MSTSKVVILAAMFAICACGGQTASTVTDDAGAEGGAGSRSGAGDGGSLDAGDASSGSGGSGSPGSGGSCSAPNDSCCCKDDVVTTPTCNADGLPVCGAGFTLHQGSVCACSTPGVCCTPAPDAGPCATTTPAVGQTCSHDGATCHYSGPHGEIDCGCTGGSWQCYSGCSPSITNYPIDPALCTPQLQTATTCNPYSGVCGFTVALPCSGDGGTPIGDLDAGPIQCTDWCKAVAPANGPSQVECLWVEIATTDGGAVVVGHCNGCGA